MSLKTKLVLAITSLSFCVDGGAVVVYVSIVAGDRYQSFDNNVLCEARYVCAAWLRRRPKDRRWIRTTRELRELTAAANPDNRPLTAVVSSVNRLLATVYASASVTAHPCVTTGLGSDDPVLRCAHTSG